MTAASCPTTLTLAALIYDLGGDQGVTRQNYFQKILVCPPRDPLNKQLNLEQKVKGGGVRGVIGL